MTPTNDAESRARFEALAQLNEYSITWSLMLNDYADVDTRRAMVVWRARDAEVAAKDARIVGLECNIGTYRSILDEKNNDIAALTKRKNEAEYESASWKRQLDTLREQHDAHTARVKMETLRYAAQVCEGLMPETAIADDVLHAWCEATIECAETLDKLADQTAKEAQP